MMISFVCCNQQCKGSDLNIYVNVYLNASCQASDTWKLFELQAQGHSQQSAQEEEEDIPIAIEQFS